MYRKLMAQRLQMYHIATDFKKLSKFQFPELTKNSLKIKKAIRKEVEFNEFG